MIDRQASLTKRACVFAIVAAIIAVLCVAVLTGCSSTTGGAMSSASTASASSLENPGETTRLPDNPLMLGDVITMDSGREIMNYLHRQGFAYIPMSWGNVDGGWYGTVIGYDSPVVAISFVGSDDMNDTDLLQNVAIREAHVTLCAGTYGSYQEALEAFCALTGGEIYATDGDDEALLLTEIDGAQAAWAVNFYESSSLYTIPEMSTTLEASLSWTGFATLDMLANSNSVSTDILTLGE